MTYRVGHVRRGTSMLPRAESTAPASCAHCAEGETKAEQGPDEKLGVFGLKCENTHRPHTLSNASTCIKSTASHPRHFRSILVSTLRPCRSQQLPNAHTGSYTTAHPIPCQAIPSHVAPDTPAPHAHPTFPRSQALGTLLQPPAPSGPSSVGSPTPPLLPTDILEPPLISLEEQHSLPARPAAWLSCGVSPHPPPSAERESLAQEMGSPGQPGPSLCQAQGSGGGGMGICAGSKGAWPTGHPAPPKAMTSLLLPPPQGSPTPRRPLQGS